MVLLATAPHFAASLGCGRATACIGLLGNDGLMQHGGVRGDVPDPSIELGRRNDLAPQILNRHFHQAPICFLIRTRPPLGPGTVPLTATMFWLGSTRTTRRFFTVTRSRPMWPAILMPLITRPGVVPEPIEPGARQRSD